MLFNFKKRRFFLKKYITLFVFSICVLFGLSACVQPASIYGSFQEENYTINVGQTIDLSEQLSLTGVSLDAVSVEFSNEGVLTYSNSALNATESGQTLVFIKYNQQTIAQCEVNVNYQFSYPQNLQISLDGTLSWEESYINNGKEIVKAQGYIVYIGDTREHIVSTNSFSFSGNSIDFGSYKVRIQAVANEEKHVLASEISPEQTVVYDYISVVEGLNLEVSSTFLDQQATLSWNHTEDAIYDVVINGFKVNNQSLTSARFTYDFARFANGREITVEIVAKDRNNSLLQTSSIYTLNKLRSVDPTFEYRSADGYLIVNDSQNTNGYIVNWTGIDNEISGQKIIQGGQREYLDELRPGLYNISIQSLGGKVGDSLYLNSSSGQSFVFAKLTSLEPQITYSTDGVTINFDNTIDEYIENCKIVVGSYSQIVNITDSKQITIEASYFEEGENSLEIYSVPTADDSSTGVKYYVQGETQTNRVLNSAPYSQKVYKLSSISNITHAFSQENANKSILTFPNVEFADSFKVTVNNQDVKFEYQISSQNTEITFENLSQKSPEGNTYTIEIEALREDGLSLNSFGIKVLTILSAPTVATRENGQYCWNKVDGEVSYQYTIYKTDSNQENEEFYLTETTDGLCLNQPLTFGYYLVQVTAVSKDVDQYLDSNFANATGILEENIIVYEQIETPEVLLVESEGKFSVVINNVQYAGHYSILLDGEEIDSFDVMQDGESFTRELIDQTFTQEKTYKLEVVASAGTGYDSTLHTESKPAVVNIIRIASPSYQTEESYSSEALFGIEGEYGEKIAENLIVSSGSDDIYVDHYEIFINGYKANADNGAQINLINQGENCTISAYAVAKQQEGNNYYLSSGTSAIEVKRISKPTNLAFANEIISIEDTNSNTQKYFVEVELQVPSGNRTIRFFTDTNDRSFNLQDKLDEFLNNQSFANEFAQATGIKVGLSAYVEPYQAGGVLYLQSAVATTVALQTELSIAKMPSTKLSFDAGDSQNILSWDAVGSGTVYDVYNNNTLVAEDYSGSSIYLSQVLNGGNLTTQNMTFYVIAKNPSYLNSSASNKIEIAKLSALSSARLIDNGGEWQIGLTITKESDVGRIQKILVNNSEISFTPGSSTILIDLATYLEESYTLSVQFIASNGENVQIYYVNSDIFNIVLTNVADKELNGQIEDETISWQNPYQSWQEENVIYNIKVEANGTQFEINSYKQTSISLDQLESLIGTTFNYGQVYVTVEASLTPCQITLPTLTNYGNASQRFSTKKVQAVGAGEVSSILGTSSDLIEQQLTSKAVIKFEDIWSSDVSFDVYINSTETVAFENLTVDRPYADCSISLADSYFTLSISSSLLTNEGENMVYIKAKQTNSVSAEITAFTITRNSNIVSASLNSNGTLAVNLGEFAKDTLLVKLKIANAPAQYYQYALTGNLETIDLSAFLEGVSGNVDLELLVIDSTSVSLSNLTKYEIAETKLGAISNITTDGRGKITFSIPSNSSNIEFVVKDELGEVYSFNPTKVDAQTYTYYLYQISTQLGLTQGGTYNISFANRIEGSLNSDYLAYQLNFKIEEQDMIFKYRLSSAQDYIIIKQLPQETGLSTSGLNIVLSSGSGRNKNIFIDNEIVIAGYWDANSQSFKTSLPSYNDERDNNVFKSYALSINNLAQSITSGSFTIDIYRVAEESGNIYTYNKSSFQLIKLNSISGADISYSRLSWRWSRGSTPTGTTPSNYIISYWQEGGEDLAQSITTVNTNYDLKTISLSSGQYNFAILAVSQNENVIASTVSQSITATKYAKTRGVTLDNGRIVFDLTNQDGGLDTSLDFVQVFYSTENSGNLAENFANIGGSGFEDIFSFQSTTINDQIVKLVFEETDSQGQTSTGRQYVVTINAKNLLSDFIVPDGASSTTTFLNRLENYSYDSSSQIIVQNLKNFYETIKDIPLGISDGEIIFDDFGKPIPNGYYNVSVVQTAKVQTDDFIDSDPSSQKLIYVSASPTMTLSSQFDQSTGVETYKATYQVRNIVADNGNLTNATEYIMLFRNKNADTENRNLYRFELKFDSSAWSMEYEGRTISNVITGDSNSFTINFTTLGETRREDSDDYLIDKNNQYYVYVYAVGNSRSCYGKSEQLDLTFLSISPENLSLTEGQFVITTSGNEIGSDILLRYRRQYSSGVETQEEIKRVSATGGRVVLNDYLTTSGKYDYVIFNVMGQLNNVANYMKLPSVSYGILNLYKLNIPTLTTTSNMLQITANSADRNYGPFKYKFAGEENIASTDEFYGTSGYQTLYFDHIATNISGEQTITFVPSNDILQFTIQDYNASADFEKLINEQVVLASNESSISLQKLPQVENVRISSGDVVWDKVNLTGLSLASGVSVVYKVVVEYCDDSQSYEQEEFYTKNTRLNTTLIDFKQTQGDGRYFKFTVYVYAGAESESGEALVEGGYIDISSPVKLANGANILSSAGTVLNEISKADTPQFAISDQVSNGKFALLREQTNLSFAVELRQVGGNGEWISLRENRDFMVTTGSLQIEDSAVNVYFIEIINPDYATSLSFTLNIYAYTTTAIKSSPLTTNAVYKLSAVSRDDIVLSYDIDSETNFLSFENYFNNNKYLFENNMYEIVLSAGDSTIVLDNTNMVINEEDTPLVLNNLETEWTIFVRGKQNQTRYLTSQNFVFNISKFVEIKVEEEPAIEFKAEIDLFQFTWNFAKAENYDVNKDYQFVIQLIYTNNNQEIVNIEESEVTSYNLIETEGGSYKNYYYQPKLQGFISTVNLFARELKTTNDLELYGNITVDIGLGVDFTIFAGGDGSKENPYQIANTSQFNNISLRDSKEEMIYFVLVEDLTFNLGTTDFALENLYGSLDGDGHIITVNVQFEENKFDSPQTIEKKVVSLPNGQSFDFEYAFGVIKNVNEGAIVKNMDIKLSHDLTKATNFKSTVIAGLAIQNAGTISNVSLISLDSTFGRNISTLAIGGIVAFNSGLIENCEVDSADGIAMVPQSSTAINLLFGGIVLQNEGQVLASQNQSNIAITITRGGHNIYLGGVVYENAGELIAVGNNGTITASGVASFSSNIAGVVGYNSGSAEYIFNNGQVSSSQNSGSAGLVYCYTSGRIANAFEFTGAQIISLIIGGQVSQGTIYGSGNSTTSIKITSLNELNNGQVFNLQNYGYTITISVIDGKYSAILSASQI